MKMKKCKSCGTYTLRDKCPNCGSETGAPHPPKFSPEDPYGEYRRQLKKKEMDLGDKD
ncbi:MAG: RNA-protein complex protein Nop10 [Candidatus Aenigmatarchaeota archaeon]